MALSAEYQFKEVQTFRRQKQTVQ